MPSFLARAAAATLAWAIVALCTPVLAGAQQPSSGCTHSPKSDRFIARLTAGGVKRSALVNVPRPESLSTPSPLVLTFHGAGSDARGTEASTGMTDLGNREGFITVYPSAIGRYWNVTGRNPHARDDVTFVDALLDQLEAELCVDDARVYATGVSNGGSFVARIGCELSERIWAIAPVAGGYGVQPACRPSRPVSVLEIHGTDDRTVPYDRRGPNGETGVWSFLGQWNSWDACPRTAPLWRRLAPRALWVAKADCAGGTTVAHIKLIGEQHAWPTTKWVGLGHHVGALFSARNAVWEFFAAGTVSAPPFSHKGRRRSSGYTN
jgi:polyhydroxybutyrate depolymerase